MTGRIHLPTTTRRRNSGLSSLFYGIETGRTDFLAGKKASLLRAVEQRLAAAAGPCSGVILRETDFNSKTSILYIETQDAFALPHIAENVHKAQYRSLYVGSDDSIARKFTYSKSEGFVAFSSKVC